MEVIKIVTIVIGGLTTLMILIIVVLSKPV
jgi:hypothetical protein